MLKLRELKLIRKVFETSSCALSTRPSAKLNDEYTETPQYPEIQDLSYKARKSRKAQAWHEQVKNVTTIEGKLIKLNMPRYYGYRMIMLGDNRVHYNSLPLSQHYTRTLFENVTKLPEYYAAADASVDSYLKTAQADIEELIGFGTFCHRYRLQHFKEEPHPGDVDRMLGYEIATQIHRYLILTMREQFPHLEDTEFDLDPRHDAFWFVGGVDPPEVVRKMRKGTKWQEPYMNDPVDRAVQYLGKPYLAMRHKFPLKEIKPMIEESREVMDKVPLFRYDARTLGYESTHRHGTTTPGFWPGDPHEFGLVSYQCRDFLLRSDCGGPDTNDLLHSHAIQSSYGWLLAQACYQGFSTYNDLTYPLATQTVTTNGQYWSYYVYQMNTCTVHTDCVYNNPKVNYCWGMDQQKLFEEVDESGKCIGFNADVLKPLIHFYANAPAERVGVEMKPYLGKDEQKVGDIKDEKRRVFLEQTFKHLMSNRPRHRLLPEIYLWEKIYKIDHKTRQMEPKRRFFELGQNPFKRTLDDHYYKYIPRDLRPLGRRSKVKFEEKYYP